MKHSISKLTFGIISFLFTAFVFLNTYEVVAGKDIPIALSLRKMQSQDVLNKVVKEFEIKPDSRSLNSNSKLDNLDYLEIESMGIKVRLEESRKIDSLWYQRPSMAHYAGLNKDDNGNIVDYLIYTDKSWRTISYANEISKGTEIKFYTKEGFGNIFIVDEKMILPINKAFVVNKSEKRQMLLLVEDEQNNQYFGYSLISKS